ncbi:hypothetical protein NDU88_006751 [Pleurodeles waltl]|uniref:Secreted protein n=1 Tax=Pleurodeles waltl TaxID=8319 RepID=A0AAV7PMA6_PLEWA|nr:hypothetical protein NDU88_006751 [Pleurodeles waltl]
MQTWSGVNFPFSRASLQVCLLCARAWVRPRQCLLTAEYQGAQASPLVLVPPELSEVVPRRRFGLRTRDFGAGGQGTLLPLHGRARHKHTAGAHLGRKTPSQPAKNFHSRCRESCVLHLLRS